MSRVFAIAALAAIGGSLCAGSSSPAAITSASGRQIAFISSLTSGRLALVNTHGVPVRSLTKARDVSAFDWSPDGAKLVFVRQILVGYDRDEEVTRPTIFVVNADGSSPRRLSPQGVWDEDPEWSPDGQKIVFTRTSDLVDGLANDIWVMRADGSGARRLTRHRVLDREATWSPDGRKIAWVRSWPDALHVMVMNADGTDQHRLLTSKLQATNPAWAPDGRLLAVTGFDTKEVYTVAPDGSDLKRVVKRAEFDTTVDWAPDGKRIAFSHNGSVYVATTSGRLRAPRRVHSGYSVDWSPDGTHLAFDDLVRDGVGVLVIRDGGHGARRLASGHAPAWRP